MVTARGSPSATRRASLSTSSRATVPPHQPPAKRFARSARSTRLAALRPPPPRRRPTQSRRREMRPQSRSGCETQQSSCNTTTRMAPPPLPPARHRSTRHRPHLAGGAHADGAAARHGRDRTSDGRDRTSDGRDRTSDGQDGISPSSHAAASYMLSHRISPPPKSPQRCAVGHRAGAHEARSHLVGQRSSANGDGTEREPRHAVGDDADHDHSCHAGSAYAQWASPPMAPLRASLTMTPARRTRTARRTRRCRPRIRKASPSEPRP